MLRTVALLLTLTQPTPPGTLITLDAQCSVGGTVVATAQAYIAVVNPVFADKTFYLTAPDRVNARGEQYHDPHVAGLRVRWMQNVGAGQIVCEGVRLIDGRILTSDGTILGVH